MYCKEAYDNGHIIFKYKLRKLLQCYKCIVKTTEGGAIKINFAITLPNVHKCAVKKLTITIKDNLQISPTSADDTSINSVEKLLQGYICIVKST